MKVKLITIGALLLAISTAVAAEEAGGPSAIVPPQPLVRQDNVISPRFAAAVPGITEVDYTVGQDGTTANIRIVRTSGWKELDQAAFDEVAQWLFRPASRAGKPVDFDTKVYISRGASRGYPGWSSPPLGHGNVDAVNCENDVRPAIETCSRVIAEAAGKQQAVAYVHRGAAYDQAGEHDKALADYTAAIAIDSANVQAFRGRALNALAAGRQQDALADLNKALIVDPKSGAALADRAFVFDSLGESDAAKADYGRLVDLAPSCAPIHVSNCENQYGRRLQSLDNEIKNSPDDVSALNARCAERALINRDLELAIADCERAASLAPDYVPVHEARAFIDLRLGRYSDAVKEVDAMPAKDMGSTPLYIRGIARLRTGDNIGGRADILAAKTLDVRVAADMAWCGITP